MQVIGVLAAADWGRELMCNSPVSYGAEKVSDPTAGCDLLGTGA